MFKRKNLTTLTAIAFFSGCVCSCFALAGNAGNQEKATAPVASPEEAKIRHWQEPEIDLTFWDIPELEIAYIDSAPIEHKDGLAVGEVGANGGNTKFLTELAQEIAEKKHTEVDSLLIAQKGKLLFESYFSRGRLDLPHPQSSTTKSYTALALGRAIQLGYLSMADLDKPLISLLKGLDTSNFAPGVEKITLHHAMNMRSGLKISAERIKEYRENPSRFTGVKQVQAFLEDTAPITDASQTFDYQGANPILVMHVIEAAVPGSASAFIERELLGKMGIANFDWRTDASGLIIADSSSSMTSRNMVKIGSLVLNKGKWNGEQLIPQTFIEKATNASLKLTPQQVQNFYAGDDIVNSGYGYFWWPADMKVNDKHYSTTSAQGGGGITILVVEELELVVVVTAHSMQAFVQLIAERVLPAFIDS